MPEPLEPKKEQVELSAADRQALVEYVARHVDRPEIVEEIVQEAIVYFLLDPQPNKKGALGTIARRLIRNEKIQTRIDNKLRGSLTVLAPEYHEPDVDHTNWAIVLEILPQLPEPHRRVVLALIDGENMEEIVRDEKVSMACVVKLRGTLRTILTKDSARLRDKKIHAMITAESRIPEVQNEEEYRKTQWQRVFNQALTSMAVTLGRSQDEKLKQIVRADFATYMTPSYRATYLSADSRTILETALARNFSDMDNWWNFYNRFGHHVEGILRGAYYRGDPYICNNINTRVDEILIRDFARYQDSKHEYEKKD